MGASTFNPRGGAREREESDRVGKLLRGWSRDGEKGRLFDGVSNIRIDGRVAHFELGEIPEHATEMRAPRLISWRRITGRQKIITMPRSVPKIAIFEEAARTIEIPGGVRMIQEYYRQMREFGCNILGRPTVRRTQSVRRTRRPLKSISIGTVRTPRPDFGNHELIPS